MFILIKNIMIKFIYEIEIIIIIYKMPKKITSTKFREDWDNLVTKSDIDGDKVISIDEMKGLIAEWFQIPDEEKEEMFEVFKDYLKRFDENKDGKWSQDELELFYQEIYSHAVSQGMIQDE